MPTLEDSRQELALSHDGLPTDLAHMVCGIPKVLSASGLTHSLRSIWTLQAFLLSSKASTRLIDIDPTTPAPNAPKQLVMNHITYPSNNSSPRFMRSTANPDIIDRAATHIVTRPPLLIILPNRLDMIDTILVHPNRD